MSNFLPRVICSNVKLSHESLWEGHDFSRADQDQ
jgi:hypothetical protein